MLCCAILSILIRVHIYLLFIAVCAAATELVLNDANAQHIVAVSRFKSSFSQFINHNCAVQATSGRRLETNPILLLKQGIYGVFGATLNPVREGSINWHYYKSMYPEYVLGWLSSKILANSMIGIPPQLNFHLEWGESPAPFEIRMGNSRHGNHNVVTSRGTTWKPGNCSIGKKLLSVHVSTP